MINYPNNLKKESVLKYNNYSNRGMTLESLLNDTNYYYLINDIAVVYKKPTPIQIVKTNGVKITDAYFKEPSTTDYNGLYRGYYLDFEAKETTSKTSFPIKNIHKHQITHIRKVLDNKGIVFIIVRFIMLDKIFLLFGNDLINYIDSIKKKSIPLKYFIEKGYLINIKLNPKIDYIEIINKYGGLL